jgi:hypothetical protein
MVHQERLEIGEKCFVSSVMAVLALEAALTVITLGIHFSWAGLILGVAGFCLVMGLANRLYAGSLMAHRIAMAWIGFQVLYAVFALFLLASSAQGAEIARAIGAPVAWAVVLKVLAYLSLGWVLLRIPAVSDFFATRRGEVKLLEPPVPQVAETPVPPVPLTLTAEQNAGLQSLSKFIRFTVGALITLGILQMIASVVVFKLHSVNLEGFLVLIQGILTAVLGMALGGPAFELRRLSNPSAQTKGGLISALGCLLKFYQAQVVIGLLLAIVMVVRFILPLI